MTGDLIGICCAPPADPLASWAEVSAVGAESGTGVAVDGGRTGSGGAAEELDAVDLPQSSAVQPLPE